LAAAHGAIQENVLLAIGNRYFRSGVEGAQRLAAADPQDPQALYLLGEAYRSLGPRRKELSAEERSPDGRHAADKEFLKRTPEEEERELAETPEGREALRSNQKTAGELFLRAVKLDARAAKPHLGLGMLFSQQGRAPEARAEYRRYLELAPAAPDRLRVEKRLLDLGAAPAH
jgi:Flp pilus assembly protein TadD